MNVKLAQEEEQKKKRDEALLEWKKQTHDELVKIATPKDTPIVVTENVKLAFR